MKNNYLENEMLHIFQQLQPENKLQLVLLGKLAATAEQSVKNSLKKEGVLK